MLHVRHSDIGRVALLTAASILSYSCTHTPLAAPAAPRLSPATTALAASIAAAEKVDPNSPAALDARLAYADFLVEKSPDSCALRLALARSQLDAVAANPASVVMFPDGSPRLADLEYRLHRAHAACEPDPAVHALELRAALEAAQRAVQLNRDAFDYPAMAVAQFNVAATDQALGNDPEALRALEAAIALDREFGLAADARDNYASLLNWRQQPAGPDQVARQMVDFPSRSISLKFAWTASDATVAISRSSVGVADNQLLHTQGSRVFERRVRAQSDGWAVTFLATAGVNDFGVWPLESDASGPPAVFRPTLLQFPDFELTGSGDFKSVTDLAAFASRITTDAQTQIRERAPAHGAGRKLLGSAVQAAKLDFAPEVIAQQAAEDYELDTAMWIGATLAQGVHYELVAPMELAGIPWETINHHLDFVFTREVPCPDRAIPHPCVELIVRAMPEGQPLEELVASYPVRYSASTMVRIVTDPETLQTFLRDTRRYWYVTIGAHAGIARLLQSDRSVITSRYE